MFSGGGGVEEGHYYVKDVNTDTGCFFPFAYWTKTLSFSYQNLDINAHVHVSDKYPCNLVGNIQLLLADM
jgi:hypothetical protein